MAGRKETHIAPAPFHAQSKHKVSLHVSILDKYLHRLHIQFWCYFIISSEKIDVGLNYSYP